MSGLVCAIHTGSESLVKRMLKTMNPRGTKDEAIRVHDGMIFARTGRPQVTAETPPFESADGKLTIVFHGTLFNAASIRPHLRPKAKGSSDAEIVLSLYKMRGRKCVHYLDGMFAFVLRDRKQFYAARDPLGIKPLYYARSDDGGWLFATEMKAFPKDAKLAEFPVGCYFDSEAGARRYYKLPDGPAKQVNHSDAVELVRVLVTDAVKKQMPSGVEAGVYLTGSLESCIIAAIAAQKIKKLKTYSVGLEGTADGYTAKKIASWLGTDHTHREIKQQDILDNLQQIIYSVESFDGPIVRHAVADYFAVLAAAEATPVLLSGDGANELFGGYPYLRPMFAEKLANEIRTITGQMHRTHLQRWDRMTGCHGVEGRVPFADRRLVHAAFYLPANMKINEDGRSKWALRRAFSTVLPAWVVDRPDNDDTHFVGIQTALHEYAETVFTDEDLQAHKQKDDPGKPVLRTKDELLYFQLWSTRFPAGFVPLVGRTQF